MSVSAHIAAPKDRPRCCLTRCRAGPSGWRRRRSTSGTTGPRRQPSGAELTLTSRSGPVSTLQTAPMARPGCAPSCAGGAARCPRRRWSPPWPARGLQGRAPKRRRWTDPPRQAGRAGSGPAAAGLHRRPRQREVGRGLQTGRHRRGAGVPRHRRGSVLQADAGLRAVRPSPHRGAGHSRDQHGRRGARRHRRRGNLPHRQGLPNIPQTRSRRPVSGSGSPSRWDASAAALDNAAAESFFSTLEHELISRRRWRTRDQARRDIAVWIDTWYNRKRLHSTNNMTSPIDYELANAA